MLLTMCVDQEKCKWLLFEKACGLTDELEDLELVEWSTAPMPWTPDSRAS
jgi:hypothetical protein